MDVQDKQSTIRRYEQRLSEFGKSIKVMGWRNKKQQDLRFQILSEVGSLGSRTVLDVGCGFGDLYSFLQKKGVKVQYTGFDISKELVKVASVGHPEASFRVKDILEEPVKGKFDYVLSSGVFNHRLSNNLKFTKSMIARMFELAREGVAVNMMTDFVDYKDQHLYYYSPLEIFKFAKSLSRFVVLRHDYPLYEFTIYIYRKGERR